MNQVKKYRKLAGLNQSELGQQAGLTQSAICQYEQQIRQPNGRSLVQLSEALGVSPAILLGNAQPDPQTMEDLDLSAISRVKMILDWWQINSDVVIELEALSIEMHGDCDRPLATLLKKLKAP
ncbi:MAG: helix-turn-helix domain-containing protein [Microcoleus sp.]